MPAGPRHLPHEVVGKWVKAGRVGKNRPNLHFEIPMMRGGEAMTVAVLAEHVPVRRRVGIRASMATGFMIVMLSNGRSDADICTNEQGHDCGHAQHRYLHRTSHVVLF